MQLRHSVDDAEWQSSDDAEVGDVAECLCWKIAFSSNGLCLNVSLNKSLFEDNFKIQYLKLLFVIFLSWKNFFAIAFK